MTDLLAFVTGASATKAEFLLHPGWHDSRLLALNILVCNLRDS